MRSIGRWFGLGAAAILGVGCFEPADGEGDAGGRDTNAEVSWTSTIQPLTETFTLTPSGGEYKLFADELRVVAASGMVTQPLQVSVTRQVVGLRGTETLGYVWGPYTRFTPPLQVRVTLAASSLPPGASAEADLGLYTLGAADAVTRLANASMTSGDPVELAGDLPVTATVVVWTAALESR